MLWEYEIVMEMADYDTKSVFYPVFKPDKLL